MTDIERNAYHEAGHAVMCVVYRIPLRKVTVKPRGETGGVVNMWRRTWQRDDMTLRIIIRCAGLAAESVHYGESPETMSVGGPVMDWFEARDLVEELLTLGRQIEVDEGDVMNFLDLMNNQALMMLKRFWPAVEALAVALQNRQTLTGKEATAIIHGALEALGGTSDKEVNHERR